MPAVDKIAAPIAPPALSLLFILDRLIWPEPSSDKIKSIKYRAKSGNLLFNERY
jgi:hypothetical protein